MTLLRARRQGRVTVRAALALVLGVAALGLGAGCSAPPPTPAPASTTCKLPDPRPALVRGSLRLPATPSVLILGDSYTQGYGAEPETKGYAYLVGKPLGWRVTVAGVGGTGYVNPGKNDAGTFLQRLPSLRGRTFDLVVLQGSSNDHDVGYPELHDAVSRTVDAVRTEFPGAVVVILGPSTPYGKPDPTRVLVQCVLAWYSTQQHLTFIDPLGERWFVDGDSKRYANPANGHPSNAGYRQIADRFVADARMLQGSAETS